MWCLEYVIVIVLVWCILFCNEYECAEPKYKVRYFDQTVNHFTFTGRDTFRQRYLMYDKDWDHSGGPIFFFTGGEMNIETYAHQMGIMHTWCKEFKALLIFGEHRYYGDSLPFGPQSFYGKEKRDYLTTEQALADYALLIDHIKTNVSGAAKSHVITWGGGYAGMLAVWMRARYPHFILGAYASSAPLGYYSGEVPCGTLLRSITDSFKMVSEQCVSSIRRSWLVIQRMTESLDGRRFLSDAFHTCQPVTKENVFNLFRWLKESYKMLAMYDYPFATDLFGKVPEFPVKEACGFLWNSLQSDHDLVRNLHRAASVMYNSSGNAVCYSLDNSAQAHVAWKYQVCTEMVMPVCSDGTSDMFSPKPWDFSKMAKRCQQKFGVIPDPRRLQRLYGGTHLGAVTNIVITNNQRDPWYAGGILTSTESVTSITIRNGAHAHDLRAPSDQDPISVGWARSRVKAVIRRWLRPIFDLFG